jgi:hypothetical protein
VRVRAVWVWIPASMAANFFFFESRFATALMKLRFTSCRCPSAVCLQHTYSVSVLRHTTTPQTAHRTTTKAGLTHLSASNKQDVVEDALGELEVVSTRLQKE